MDDHPDDAERDHALAQLGVRTLRIPNQWMDQDLPGVLSMIAEATSPLAPLPSGEGNADPGAEGQGTMSRPLILW